MAGRIILSTAYGIDVLPEDDPHIDISEKALHAMACTGNRGSFLVDSLPLCVSRILRHFLTYTLTIHPFSLKYVPEFFPGAGFKKQAREWSKVVDAMPHVPYDFVKKARVRCCQLPIVEVDRPVIRLPARRNLR
jgi:hypothetical protein